MIQIAFQPDKRTPDPFARRPEPVRTSQRGAHFARPLQRRRALLPGRYGLSRQHLAIERDGEGWALRDLGSKNGTMLNGARITGRMPLKPGDRITAGHLILVYDGASSQTPKPVVVFDPREESRGADQLLDRYHPPRRRHQKRWRHRRSASFWRLLTFPRSSAPETNWPATGRCPSSSASSSISRFRPSRRIAAC